MAKGFTVKTVPPKKKTPDVGWDIDAIKQRMQGKKIVFCLPGRGCSYVFLKNFVSSGLFLTAISIAASIKSPKKKKVNS